MSTPEMDEAKHRAAKVGGSWHLPTIEGTFGWLRNWNWMVTLFLIVSVGIATPQFIDDKIDPEPGKFTILFLPFVVLGTIGLNAVKEYYERAAEKRRETDNSELMTKVGHLEAENDLLRQRIAEVTGGN